MIRLCLSGGTHGPHWRGGQISFRDRDLPTRDRLAGDGSLYSIWNETQYECRRSIIYVELLIFRRIRGEFPDQKRRKLPIASKADPQNRTVCRTRHEPDGAVFLFCDIMSSLTTRVENFMQHVLLICGMLKTRQTICLDTFARSSTISRAFARCLGEGFLELMIVIGRHFFRRLMSIAISRLICEFPEDKYWSTHKDRKRNSKNGFVP